MSQFLTYGCSELTYSEQKEIDYQVLRAYWLFTVSKLIDLVDTIFFVLKKKTQHVSYLHLQHHTLALFATWFYGRYWPGQEFLVIGFINVFIHVFLYFYYLLAALGPNFKKYLWWKKYLTQMQIVQFIVNIVFMSVSFNYLYCGYNPVKVIIGICMNLFNLVLFSHFYYNSYLVEKNPSRFHPRGAYV